MKKYLICSSLIVLSSSLCFAQDTIVFKNGHRQGVKVISFGDKVIFSVPPGDRQFAVRSYKIKYIKYQDGSTYTVNNNIDNPSDTLRIEFKPYLLFSGGASLPIAGYGTNYNTPDVSINGYSGSAYNGTDFSVTAGLFSYGGWHLVGMFSYIRNGFNGQEIVNETLYSFIEGDNFTTVNTSGNYYYTNYTYLVGLTKSSESKYGGIGFSLMFGDFNMNIPAINGVVTNYLPSLLHYNYYYYNNYNPSVISNPNYTFTLNRQTFNRFVVELGLHGDINITKHIFFRAQCEFEFSDILTGGNFQFTDKYGNTVYSGSYTGNNQYPSSFFTWIFDATAGLGYKF